MIVVCLGGGVFVVRGDVVARVTRSSVEPVPVAGVIRDEILRFVRGSVYGNHAGQKAG